MQHSVQKTHKVFVERLPDGLVAEGRAQILRREQACADRPSDSGRQALLALGDRPLEHLQAALPDARGFVRVKEHPDGDRIGEPARQGAGDYKNCGTDQLFGHASTSSALNVAHEPPYFE